MVLNKICCIDHRIGIMVIAIFEVLAGLGSLGLSFFEYYNIVGTCIPISIGSISTGACIFYGALKQNTMATFVSLILLPIVFCVVLIGLTIAFIIFTPAISMYYGVLIYWPFTLLIVGYLVCSILKIYFWLCVFTFYRQMKSDGLKFLNFLGREY